MSLPHPQTWDPGLTILREVVLIQERTQTNIKPPPRDSGPLTSLLTCNECTFIPHPQRMGDQKAPHRGAVSVEES